MTFDRLLGFHASAGRRLIFAGIYAALAFAAAWAVERAPMMSTPETVKPPTPVADPALVPLRCETTYPVGAWTVQVGGKPVNAASSDARHWEGRVPAGASVFVQADHTDATAATPAALRWTSGGASGIQWADGFVAATIQLPEAAR